MPLNEVAHRMLCWVSTRTMAIRSYFPVKTVEDALQQMFCVWPCCSDPVGKELIVAVKHVKEQTFHLRTKERHAPICRKLVNKKRKPFNSLKQRLQGTDIPTVRRDPQHKSQPVRKSNWRRQHEEFISAIRAAKLCTLAMKEGRPLPPPPAPTINPDYIQCPYCMRRFNETAAKRHINFCKDHSSRRVFDAAKTAARLASRAQGRGQASPPKEPTVTSAVRTMLQNRALESMKEVSTKPGVSMDPATKGKLSQGFRKSKKY